MTDEQYDGIIEAINNQNMKCENYNYDISKLIYNGYINSSGTVIDNSNYKYTDYIPIQIGQIYTININYETLSPSYCLYNQDKVKITCTSYNRNRTFTINNQEASYIRYSGSSNSQLSTTFTGQYCYNLIEKQNEKIDSIIGGIIFIIGILFVISLLTRRLRYR